jgi:hypothetical protein
MAFRWTYIMLPALMLLLSVILAAFFYHRLRPDVAYHFAGGVPDRWLGRGAVMAWMLVPQFVLFLGAVTITWLASRLVTRLNLAEGALTRKALCVMGNIVALPQVILVFAMLYIFLYNTYRVHLIPMWVFTLVIMVLGGIFLGIFLVRSLQRYRGPPGKTLKER